MPYKFAPFQVKVVDKNNLILILDNLSQYWSQTLFVKEGPHTEIWEIKHFDNIIKTNLVNCFCY
jgi:hypothetical protein